MRESQYQKKLVDKLTGMFSNVLILKGDSSDIQGIPDLLILGPDSWAALEVKRSMNAPIQPNQQWYVDMMNEISFAAFIYPENEEDVLNALQQSFKHSW